MFFQQRQGRTRSYGGSRSSRAQPPSAPWSSRIGTEMSRGWRSTAFAPPPARVPRHRSRACLGDRDGPSAAAAGRVEKDSTDRTPKKLGRDGPGLGGNRGGNRGGNKWCPSVTPRVRSCPLRLACVQGIPHQDRNAGPLGPPPTEPKVTGSNPVGRALDKALQSQIQGNHSKLGAAGWERDGNKTPPVRRQAERVRMSKSVAR